MHSVRTLVTKVFASVCLPAIAFSVSACGDDGAGIEQERQAVIRKSTFGWLQIGDCATSIGVSPDDTLWLIGCDRQADGDIWYTRLDGDAFAQSRVWVMTNGRGQRLGVDDAGQAYVTVSNGARYYSKITTTNGNPPPAPTGEWAPWFPGETGMQEVLFNHRESYLVFHTRNDININPVQHQFYRIASPTDGSKNGKVGYRVQSTAVWTDTGMKAQSIALFTPNGGPSASKELWTLDSGGGIRTWDATLNNGGLVRPTPPSFTYGLTDHYALTTGGVYHWNDSRGDWEFYLDRTTPTGRIIQIAHAGAVSVKLPNNTFGTFESGVWAVDDSGMIYRAGESTPIF